MDFSIGDNVVIVGPLLFLKTADPMPMLRPPDLVAPEEVGKIVGLKGTDIAKVLFRRGTFLISLSSLAKSISQE